MVSALAILCPCQSARAYPNEAGWTAADAQTAFDDYDRAFYFSPDGDGYDYRLKQGYTEPTYFWEAANEIELALDAFARDPSPMRSTVVAQLCDGFLRRYGDDWGPEDSYDDDLMWATIAFVQAYHVTKDERLLNDAKANFETVWRRGHDDVFGGGIWEDVRNKNLKAAAANWTFVIAGHLLQETTGDGPYLAQANEIYSWAYTHLYDAKTGQAYGGYIASGPRLLEFSYNYGTATAAHFFEKRPEDATRTARFLTTMKNPSGATYRGFNILPPNGDPTVATDGTGFNGIALRWIGYAYVRGAIHDPGVLRWAQANVGHAWAQRNSQGLSWNDWSRPTPHGTNLYSWNCSDTVAGMLDIPPTAPDVAPPPLGAPRVGTARKAGER